MSEKIQISNAAKNTRMAFKDQINQNVGFFIYNREFLFFSGIIGSPQAFNRFQIIPAHPLVYKRTLLTNTPPPGVGKYVFYGCPQQVLNMKFKLS